MPEIQSGLIIPRHIAVIMDGNGKWAAKRSLPKEVGHKKGAEAARDIVSSCQRLGVSYLTLYVFSSENWLRPQAEIDGLMGLLRQYLKQDVKKLVKENVRLRFIGNRTRLASDIREQMENAERQTKGNEFQVVLALSYGAREEIREAAVAFARDVAAGKIPAGGELFDGYMSTYGIPDPDLLIRTGGEYRISNFLLWQLSYSEFYFCDTLWPDFSEADLVKAISSYSQRERRYGLTGKRYGGGPYEEAG